MRERWFLGIDLAWGQRRASGLAALRGGVRGLTLAAAPETRTALEDIVAWVREHPGDWCIGIDAPLVVRNASGRRPSDAAISRHYGRFEAGAHPTNLALLQGRVRGGDLVKALQTDGVRTAAAVDASRPPGSWALETYPHAGMVELLGLERTFKYKRGLVAERARELQRLADTLRHWLPRMDPPVRLEGALAAFLGVDATGLRGERLKQHEDGLDAVFCAYLAAHWWTWGAARNWILGEAASGAVILPDRGRGRAACGPLCGPSHDRRRAT